MDRFYPTYNPIIYDNGTFNNGVSLGVVQTGSGSYSLQNSTIYMKNNTASNTILYLGKINFDNFSKFSMFFNINTTGACFRVFISKEPSHKNPIYSYGWGTNTPFNESGTQTQTFSCPNLNGEYYIILDVWSNVTLDVFNITLIE